MGKPKKRQQARIEIINARSETLHSKPSFKDAKRCAVIADGWFEWTKHGVDKLPTYFHLKGRVFHMAGIYNSEGCVIVTSEAKNEFRQIHNRQPILLNYGETIDWLAGIDLFESTLNQKISFYQVDNYVNSPRNDNRQCIKKL